MLGLCWATQCAVTLLLAMCNNCYEAFWLGVINGVYMYAWPLSFPRHSLLTAPVPLLPHRTTQDKETPLHFAALKGRTEVAQLLLSQGASVDAVTRVSGRLFYGLSGLTYLPQPRSSQGCVAIACV